jgi:hypothetical protein
VIGVPQETGNATFAVNEVMSGGAGPVSVRPSALLAVEIPSSVAALDDF